MALKRVGARNKESYRIEIIMVWTEVYGVVTREFTVPGRAKSDGSDGHRPVKLGYTTIVRGIRLQFHVPAQVCLVRGEAASTSHIRKMALEFFSTFYLFRLITTYSKSITLTFFHVGTDI